MGLYDDASAIVVVNKRVWVVLLVGSFAVVRFIEKLFVEIWFLTAEIVFFFNF